MSTAPPHNQSPRPDWLALRVKTALEALAEKALRLQGFEVFLPTALERRQWSDRVKQVEKPLFPGYVFCRFPPEKMLPVLQAPAVIDVVRIGRKPAPVEDSEVEALKMVQRSTVGRRSVPLEVGQPVEVKYGALAGVRGTIVRERGESRFLIAVPLLQRSVRIEIESWQLAAPEASRKPAHQAQPQPRIGRA